MHNKILAVNRKFSSMMKHSPGRMQILAGVMLLDEYRLYQWLEAGRPANTFIDVGGHYGSFTAMAKTIWPECTVRAYEPHPVSQEQFGLNTAEFCGVTLMKAAAMPLSHTGGFTPLYLSPGDNDGGHSVCPNSERETILVPTVSLLSDLQSIGSPDIDVLKLDCEGVEAGLLSDLAHAGYLAKITFITGEWHGLDNIPRIDSALSATHDFQICRGDWPLGAFFAWRKP